MVTGSTPSRRPAEDPLELIPRTLTKLHSLWLASTYPFASLGRGLSIHYTCRLKRSVAPAIQLGCYVWVGKDTWFNAINLKDSELRLIIEDNGTIGARCQFSAKNCIHVERNVMIANSVLIMDHSHAYEDLTRSIGEQGVTEGGTVRIGEGSWIGQGAAIVCNRGELVIGRHCVIGANSVLSQSVPPRSVVLGNPARVVRQFDPAKDTWVVGAVRPATPASGVKVTETFR